MSDASTEDAALRAERRAFAGLTMAATCGTVAYYALLGNYLALFADRMKFSSVLIGLLYLAIQAPAALQVLLARRVDRHGGKRMALRAFQWSPLTALPLIFAPQVDRWLGHGPAVACVFAGVAAYALWNIAVGASWMPLLRANLPEDQMAEKIGSMNRWAMLAALAATLGFSFFLGEDAPLWRFQAIFVAGALLAGARGIYFGVVRDVVPHADAPSEPMWQALRALWADVPFRRLLLFILIAYTVGGLVGPFRPLFMTAMGFSERFAAIITAPLVLGSYALAAPVWGALADRYGSRGLYVLGGIGVVAGHLVLVLPTGHGAGDGALMALSLFLGATFWAAFDSGNIKRLFSIVPRRRQSLYMSVYMIVTSGSVAVGAFIGGWILKIVRTVLPEAPGVTGFAHGMDYRVLYLIAALGTVVAIGYSRRMMAMKEVSAARLMLYLRIRTQRALTEGLPGDLLGLPGDLLRKILPEDEE